MQTVTNTLPEITVSYNAGIKWTERPQLKSSEKAVEYFRQIWDENTLDLREETKVIYLNRSIRVVGHYHLASGSLTGCVFDIRLIAAIALKCMAAGVMVCHNHPSGDTQPSPADNEVTEKLKNALRLFDIKLFDHFILTKEGYYSFADDGKLW